MDIAKRGELAKHITTKYRSLVASRHPDLHRAWPVSSGYDAKVMTYGGWGVFVLEHTGNPAMTSIPGFGELTERVVGVPKLEWHNIEIARQNILKHFRARPSDGIVFWDPQDSMDGELERLMLRHEQVMGLTPMRLFLSHKSCDKILIRSFKDTLLLLGFDPWLDEDAMHAGVELERGILKGLADSCAAIFFITPNYVDENYLASEIDYAIAEKRKKAEKFAIITLVFDDPSKPAIVPDLLARFVWKRPDSQLEALREIVRASPLEVGPVAWRV